jgi:hypothetical protein
MQQVIFTFIVYCPKLSYELKIKHGFPNAKHKMYFNFKLKLRFLNEIIRKLKVTFFISFLL